MTEIAEMLKIKKWAVVGATNNVEKFGYKIFKFMHDAGYEVYAVNPGVKEILDMPCYAALSELPVKPEAVDIVVPARVAEQVVKDCAELQIANIWLQPGADANSVVSAAQSLGLNVVHHACVVAEIKKQGGC